MSVCLLDVNVLIALFDPLHPSHDVAHHWFARNRRRGWATCPLTINGCVRVLSSPAYPSVHVTVAEMISYLRTLCSAPEHESWQADVSLLDETAFRPQLICRASITDVYLLALAVKRDGVLATFDRSINPKAIVGAGARHLEVISPPRTE